MRRNKKLSDNLKKVLTSLRQLGVKSNRIQLGLRCAQFIKSPELLDYHNGSFEMEFGAIYAISEKTKSISTFKLINVLHYNKRAYEEIIKNLNRNYDVDSSNEVVYKFRYIGDTYATFNMLILPSNVIRATLTTHLYKYHLINETTFIKVNE